MKKFIFYKDKETVPYQSKIYIFPISALKNKTEMSGYSISDLGKRGFDWSILEMETLHNVEINLEKAIEIIGKENLDLHLSSFLPKKEPKWKAVWKE